MSPDSEQYSQSLPLYKSETSEEKPLSPVSPLSFQFLTAPILSFQIHTWVFQVTETQNPKKCMVTYEMQMSTTQTLLSTVYMFVDCCLLLYATVAFAECGSLLVRFLMCSLGCFHTSAV